MEYITQHCVDGFLDNCLMKGKEKAPKGSENKRPIQMFILLTLKDREDKEGTPEKNSNEKNGKYNP
jgi:hypothetical protein